MKVLVLGAGGQLGRAIRATCPEGVNLEARTRHDLDVTDPAAVNSAVSLSRPDAIINAAAYTSVDRAESEKDLAFAVNEQGPANLAAAAAANSAHLVHVSTDFIFDGAKSSPYEPSDSPAPLGVYGASKLAGERALESVDGLSSSIVRTAWVYASTGHNFVNTILRLLTERSEIGVVSDQVGAPTWAASLAHAIWAATVKRSAGVFHWTDSGVASWYDFAVAIREEAQSLGLISSPAEVRPITTRDYPLPAKRPPYSVLALSSSASQLSLERVHWRTNLRFMLKELMDA